MRNNTNLYASKPLRHMTTKYYALVAAIHFTVARETSQVLHTQDKHHLQHRQVAA